MENSKNKLIKYFSSGMKQRLKLALAFCSDTPMLMLDEPTNFLDLRTQLLLEDFLRDFRGDTIHPSTLEIMYELGILDEFLQFVDYTAVNALLPKS